MRVAVQALLVILLLLLLLIVQPSLASEVRWPIPDWQTATLGSQQLESSQCRNFVQFSTRRRDFKTDGLVVVQDGQIRYEFYESHYSALQPHLGWSISKTVTATLLGIAVRDGKLSLDQKLTEFPLPFPKTSALQEIRLANLLYMDEGWIWNESYGGDVSQSSVISMLYGAGHRDMLRYALNRSTTSEGPGYHWNYSTGTPVVTAAVLKQVYGKEFATLPWRSLFDPLGMKTAVFESDAAGNLMGGSGFLGSPRDLARLGYLYLNRGQWNGQQILPPEWIDITTTPSPGYLSDRTQVRNITAEGVYGGSVWLNRAVKRGFGKPYPTLPDDMYLMLGYQGQFVIVLPSQNMVIVRTGRDTEYVSKIDEFVSRALACFHDPNTRIGKRIPKPAFYNIGLWAKLTSLTTGLKAGVLQGAVAKSLCTCHFVSGLSKRACIRRTSLPAAGFTTFSHIDRVESPSPRMRVRTSLIQPAGAVGIPIGKTATAEYDPTHPELGCTLL